MLWLFVVAVVAVAVGSRVAVAVCLVVAFARFVSGFGADDVC